MGFNNAKERRKFESEWIMLCEKYRKAGFSEEGINAMRAFDEDQFRQRRRFEEHNQPLPEVDFGENGSENRSSLFERFENLTVSFDENCFTGRYAWVETISDYSLASGLKRLPERDLELLTLAAIEGYSQREIARLWGCNYMPSGKE